MDRLERFYRIHGALKNGKCLPLVHFMSDLEISRATAKRDIEYLRDRMQAPLIWDAERRGYRYDFSIAGADRYDLPGLWFDAAEIHALVVMHAVLADLAPGLLSAKLAPLISRLGKILEERQLPSAEVHRRIRVHHAGARLSSPEFFALAAQGVLQRRQMKLRHYSRRSDAITKRTVSPQRLVHYRGTWYLDTWCHLRKAVRSFSLDAIEDMHLQEQAAREVPDEELDRILATSYGIFAGAPAETAVLRFTPHRARWVRHERWHPQQRQRTDAHQFLILEFPYRDDTELLMDILRHGREVEVLAPPALRERVQAEMAAAGAQYAAV